MNEKFTSKDFFRVESKTTVKMPDTLIHKDVLGRQASTGDEQFSKERNHLVKIINLPTVTISMTLGGLEPGQHTRKHRHTYESVIYIIKGKGYSMVEDQKVEWQQGDAIYVPVWAWHQHFSTCEDQECLYIAAENAPLLQNLGGIARREEEFDNDNR